MFKHKRLLAVVSALVLAAVLFSAVAAGGDIDFGQLDGLPPEANYVAWLTKSIESPDTAPVQILTEDGYNSALGENQGYQSLFWLINVGNFDGPAPAQGDEVNLIFGGLGANSGELWAINFNWDSFEATTGHPLAPQTAASGAECPVMLPGSFTPGDPASKTINWSGAPGSYHIYRSLLPSGAGNDKSNGRYAYVGTAVIGVGETTGTYLDTLPAGITQSWHVVVPADPDTNAIIGCHSEDESSPTAVENAQLAVSSGSRQALGVVAALGLILAALAVFFAARRTKPAR